MGIGDGQVSINGQVPEALWDRSDPSNPTPRTSGGRAWIAPRVLGYQVSRPEVYTKEGIGLEALSIDMPDKFQPLSDVGANGIWGGNGRWIGFRTDPERIFGSIVQAGAYCYDISHRGEILIKPVSQSMGGLEVHLSDRVTIFAQPNATAATSQDGVLVTVEDGRVYRYDLDAPDILASRTPMAQLMGVVGRVCRFSNGDIYRAHEWREGIGVFPADSTTGWVLAGGIGQDFNPDIVARDADGILVIASSHGALELPHELQVYWLNPVTDQVSRDYGQTWTPVERVELAVVLAHPEFPAPSYALPIVPLDDPNTVRPSYVGDPEPDDPRCVGFWVGAEGGIASEGEKQDFDRQVAEGIEWCRAHHQPLFVYYDDHIFPQWFRTRYVDRARVQGVRTICLPNNYPKKVDGQWEPVGKMIATLRATLVELKNAGYEFGVDMCVYTREGEWPLPLVLEGMRPTFDMAVGLHASLLSLYSFERGPKRQPELLGAYERLLAVSRMEDLVNKPEVTVTKWTLTGDLKNGESFEFFDRENPELGYRIKVHIKDGSWYAEISNAVGLGKTGQFRPVRR